MVVLGEGPLFEQYQKYAKVHSLAGKNPAGDEAELIALQLSSEGHTSAICNTVVCGLFCRVLVDAGLHVVTLIHELPEVIRANHLEQHVRSIAQHAHKIVFPAEVVVEGFKQFTEMEDAKVVLKPQGLYKCNQFRTHEQRLAARRELRQRFSIPAQNDIVLCTGYADHRKGIDLFIDMAMKVLDTSTTVTFIWLGHWDTTLEVVLKQKVEDSGLSNNFIFPGLDYETDLYYAGSDLYTLMSREDPFPSVVMEALDVGIPVLGFEGAGGFVELLDRGCGVLIPRFDTQYFSRMVLQLLRDVEQRHELGRHGEEIIKSEYSFRHYLYALLDLARIDIKKVSVVIPNFNYAHYLKSRFTSVFDQSYPVYELIILDDASTDDSVAVIHGLMEGTGVDHQLVINEKNSGSVFHQWAKGANLAQGDYLWIAEADDLADARFLETLLTGFDDLETVLCYCQSAQIDDDDNHLSSDYQYYTDDISTTRWKSGYNQTGQREISEALAVKNTIPNVSGVVFRTVEFRKALNSNLREILSFKYAGDWLLYVHLLKQGRISYFSESLNVHRRHSTGVTISGMDRGQLDEIVKVQSIVQQEFKVEDYIKTKAEEYIIELGEQFHVAGQ